jgi:hypothetical protein
LSGWLHEENVVEKMIDHSFTDEKESTCDQQDAADQVRTCSLAKCIVKHSTKPVYLLIIVMVTIFGLETLVLLLLDWLPVMSDHHEAFLDSMPLSAGAFPAFYFLVFKPLREHIRLHIQAEAEKDCLILELKTAMERIKTLQGIIPICASCQKIRDEQGVWHNIESYVTAHSEAQF